MAAGDITYTHTGGQDSESAFASGTVMANSGAAVNVIVGFQPSMIELYYKDTGATTLDKIIVWFKGMTAGSYWNTAMSTGIITLVGTAGPTVYAGTSGATTAMDGTVTPKSEGFTIPAALMDAATDYYTYKVWR